MDKLDYKILNILKENGRETASDISKAIHLSVSAVLDRIKKMEESGIIKGYTVRVDAKALGNDVTALMEISLEHPRFHDSFTEVIMDHPNILDCYYLTGDYDFVLKISCASSDELEHTRCICHQDPFRAEGNQKHVFRHTGRRKEAVLAACSNENFIKKEITYMKTLGYYNGKYGELENMSVPMNDRVCWFGDGVYDAGPCRNYKIFAIDEHVDRFFNSAGLIRIQVPCTKAELKALLQDLVNKMDTGDLFIYFQVTRGTAVRTHEFPENVPANLWVMLKPMGTPDLYKKIRLLTQEDTRFLHCNIKTLNLLPSVMAAQKAKEAGCQEAVFHRGGRVTECAHSNCHILKDGILYTAPADNLILPGIARAHLIHVCKKLEIPVSETPYTLKEMMDADEVLVTSSTKLCVAASEIDGTPVGGRAPEALKNILDAVMDEYMEETKA